MVKIGALITCLLVPSFAHAEDNWRSKCKSLSSLAETIMKNRQAGVAMAEMMEMAEGEIKELAEYLIISAYDHPRYNTERVQQRTISDFRDEIYLQCVKASRSE